MDNNRFARLLQRRPKLIERRPSSTRRGADLNGNGHLVVFSTFASNFGGNSVATVQVMLRDLDSGALTPISSQGESSDGRFVALTSMASNLVPEDTNNRLDVFVRDTVAHTTRRVSVDSNGEQGDLDSLAPAVDAPDPASVRGTLTYTATISNGGPTAVTGLTLVGDLSPDAAFVSATGATCSRAGKAKTDGTITCSSATSPRARRRRCRSWCSPRTPEH